MVKEEFGLEELVGLRCSVAPALARLLSGSNLYHTAQQLLNVHITGLTIPKHSQTPYVLRL
jgi:hypothetical protein